MGHLNDSKDDNGINDPDNPKTHPDAYKKYVNTLFSIASHASVSPRVNNGTITSLIDKVTTSAETKQANVLNSITGSVIKATPTNGLVISPVSDCGAGTSCSTKPIGSQVNPQINKIYGVKK